MENVTAAKTLKIRRSNDRRNFYVLEVLGPISEYPRLGDNCLLEFKASRSVATLESYAKKQYPHLTVEVQA